MKVGELKAALADIDDEMEVRVDSCRGDVCRVETTGHLVGYGPGGIASWDDVAMITDSMPGTDMSPVVFDGKA